MSKDISVSSRKRSAKFKVLLLDDHNDKIIYTECLHKIGNTSPFYSTTFIKSFSDGLERLICFKWSKGNKIILLIGYHKLIKEGSSASDFYSPYGYSGPIYSKGIKNEELEVLWLEVNRWFNAHKVVTSFVRFSLNNNTHGYQGVLKNTLLNIKGLIREEGEQWKNFEPKVRKNVQRAKREGLTTQIIKGYEVEQSQLNSFYNIYTKSLSRNSATKAYYTSVQDFTVYCKTEGRSCIFTFVYDTDKMVAAEMVLLSDKSLYSFLGGTVESAFSKRPNDLLKFTLINWARENGYTYFVLGGGYGKEDGVYRYKKSFFPHDITTFYTGRQVFNQDLYTQLCDKNLEKLTSTEREKLKSIDFFPAYRYKAKQ